MGSIAITVVLIGSIIFFLFGLAARIVLRNEGRKTEAADQIIQASLVTPFIYGALVLLIGLAPLN